MHDLGAAVRLERHKKGLTQVQLAEALHTTDRTVSKIETGKTNPGLDTVVQFAHGLDISLDALFLENKEGDIAACVKTFFTGMSAERARSYIALCEQADMIPKE